MAKELNVGVIGAGRIGKLHAEHLSYRVPGARVAAVADVRLETARACAAALGIAKAAKDPRVILEDPAIDAVAICSSTDTHAPLIEAAAEAGKHIFCEKPIALDLEVIDRALEKVRKAGVKLQVGFNRRFDPNFRRVWQRVREGAVGEPHLLRISSRDPAPPPIEYVRVSGGLFLDMMIHDFDMARYLIGKEVEELQAFGGVLVDEAIGRAGDVDTAIVTLKFAGGCLGAIDNSRQAVYGYDQRVEVFGSRGMVNTENNTPNRTRLATADSVQEDLPLHFFMDRYIDSYVSEMKAFVEAVVADKDPPVGGLDARAPVVMGKAAKLSLESNRPVRLAEIRE